MANFRVNTPPTVVDSIERGTSEEQESDKVWGNVFAAVPSKSPLDRYQSTEQEASHQPRTTLSSPWTPASYSLPQRARGSAHGLQYSVESGGSTPVPSIPSSENVSRQADAYVSRRQETTAWQSPCQSGAASTDPDHSESAHGTARHVSRWSAETESGEESDMLRADQMAFEQHNSQASISATAGYEGQRTASSSRHGGSRAALRRSYHPNPKPSVEKPGRMAHYSRFLLSRIKQVATEVDLNRERYRTPGDGEEEIAVLKSIDKQLNDLLHRRAMRRGESVLPSSHWSDTGSMRDVCNDRSEGSKNDWI